MSSYGINDELSAYIKHLGTDALLYVVFHVTNFIHVFQSRTKKILQGKQ